MKALARYGLADAARQELETLSGGQKARLEILVPRARRATTCCCSTSRPTTSTSTRPRRSSRRSTASTAPSIAVSHDRTFLRQLDRFLMITDDGDVFALPDYELAMSALAAPDRTGTLRLVENLCA